MRLQAVAGGEEDLALGTHGVMRRPGSRHGSGWESAGGHRPSKLGSRVMWSEAEGPLEASSSGTVMVPGGWHWRGRANTFSPFSLLCQLTLSRG